MIAAGSLTVRDLTTHDAPAVARVATGLAAGGTADEWRAALADRTSSIAVGAVVDGRIVGYAFAAVQARFGLGPHAAWIEAFGVDPAFRAHGVGRALAGEVVVRARRAGADHVYTLVPLHDRTLDPFFRQIGLTEEPLVCLGRAL
ncbi:MAG TPA: GNAT family N-acetyltransferase [Candidatus Limnocylindria bacterium]|nr:GNAT family N-acetyltransferase [Candidatus Limnocylindria bacterium]